MSDETRVETAEWRPGGSAGRGAPLRGPGDVSAILPNGRVIWLRVEPSPVPARALEHVAQEARSGTIRHRGFARRQAVAIRVLARMTAAVAEGMSEERVARARALRRLILRSHRRLDERITKAAEKARERLSRRLRIERETVRRLRRRDLWDKAVLATSLPLFAAFGQKGRPFGAHNLALTLSSLIWLVGDDVVEKIFGPEDKSPYPLRDLDAWSYIAPVANVLAGWWLLGGFQHERFVARRTSIPLDPVRVTATGASDLAYVYLAQIDVSRVVAPSHRPAFEDFRYVPVVATIASAVPSATGVLADARITEVAARVSGADLELCVTAIARDLSSSSDPVPDLYTAIDVAWMVDTQEPATVPSS